MGWIFLPQTSGRLHGHKVGSVFSLGMQVQAGCWCPNKLRKRPCPICWQRKGSSLTDGRADPDYNLPILMWSLTTAQMHHTYFRWPHGRQGHHADASNGFACHDAPIVQYAPTLPEWVRARDHHIHPPQRRLEFTRTHHSVRFLPLKAPASNENHHVYNGHAGDKVLKCLAVAVILI